MEDELSIYSLIQRGVSGELHRNGQPTSWRRNNLGGEGQIWPSFDGYLLIQGNMGGLVLFDVRRPDQVIGIALTGWPTHTPSASGHITSDSRGQLAFTDRVDDREVAAQIDRSGHVTAQATFDRYSVVRPYPSGFAVQDGDRVDLIDIIDTDIPNVLASYQLEPGSELVGAVQGGIVFTRVGRHRWDAGEHQLVLRPAISQEIILDRGAKRALTTDSTVIWQAATGAIQMLRGGQVVTLAPPGLGELVQAQDSPLSHVPIIQLRKGDRYVALQGSRILGVGPSPMVIQEHLGAYLRNRLHISLGRILPGPLIRYLARAI